MTTTTVDVSQQRAARIAGLLYLVLMAAGLFAQVYVPGNFPGSANAPGAVASGRLFNLGAAVDLLTDVGDTAVAAAFYVLLRPVSRGIAMLGAFWRLAQVAILGGYTITNIVVLQLLSGADQTRAFTPDQLSALSWVAIQAHTAGYSIGLVFLGLGSTAFSYLLFRSRFIPRRLAAFGIFSSAVLALGSLTTIAFPEATPIVNPALYAPMFVFEVTAGLWLLIRGVR